MRTMVRKSTLAAIALCATTLAGCRQLEREIEFHFGPMHRTEAVEREAPPRRVAPPRRERSPVVRRVAEPRMIPAGARIRQFCGQRHIQFQRGTLRETASEAARNNVLCSQS